jgi:hypothetical protein
MIALAEGFGMGFCAVVIVVWTTGGLRYLGRCLVSAFQPAAEAGPPMPRGTKVVITADWLPLVSADPRWHHTGRLAWAGEVGEVIGPWGEGLLIEVGHLICPCNAEQIAPIA